MLRFNYSIRAHEFLNDPERAQKLRWMKEAHVSTLWIDGYFFGHYDSTWEEMVQVKQLLETEGFEAQVVSVPVGHPGNSLDPNDESLDLKIPDHWSYRIDRYGKPVHYCACINDAMIRDNREAMLRWKELGVTRVFFDDDLRMGNWGHEITGCFCDSCLAAFNEKYRHHFDRVQLTARLFAESPSEEDHRLQEEWQEDICQKVKRFLVETKVDGIQSGIMVMHDGCRYHGIDLPLLRQEIPDLLVRVGESHFCDKDFDASSEKLSLLQSIAAHSKLAKGLELYSESTVFPANSLTPENLIHKIELEIAAGLRNIFLMSGTWFLSEPYWKAVKESYPLLSYLAEICDTQA